MARGQDWATSEAISLRDTTLELLESVNQHEDWWCTVCCKHKNREQSMNVKKMRSTLQNLMKTIKDMNIQASEALLEAGLKRAPWEVEEDKAGGK